MPRAFDARQLTVTHSPTQRLDSNIGKLPDLFSPEQLLEQAKNFVEELLFPAIEEITGIDLAAFLPTIEAVFDALERLFGDLNPLSGTFNPLDAVTTFVELMVEVGASLPMALIQELSGFATDIPILSQIVQAITGNSGGLGDLTSFFDDIPIIGDLVAAITGSSGGLDDLTSWFTNIFQGIDLTNPGAILQAILDAIESALEDIPILGDLVEAITGTSGGLGDLTAFFDKVPFIGDLVDAITGSSGNLGDLTAFFADLPFIGDIVHAITGNVGPLTDLSNFFDGLVPLDELVDVLTGTPGDLPDLQEWVGDLPILGDLVDALTGSGGGLPDLTSWANGLTPLNAFEDLLDGLGGSFGSDLSAIVDRLDDFLTPASPLAGGNIVGEIIDDVVPGIGGILTGIFNALTGHGNTAASHAEATAALTAQNAALQGVAAQVALLNTAFTSGVSTFDDFERSDSDDLGTDWSVAYSSGPGNVYIDGHNAAWKAANLTASTRTMRARYIGANATSSTDYQRVEMILNSAPLNPLNLGVPFGTPAANDILLRCDAGFTNFIRIRFRGDGICLISRVVGGVETVMNSATIPFDMAGGATITGEAGKLGTARYFRGLINGSPACTVTEAGTASLVGSSYRGWGFGMFAGADTRLVFVPAQSKPGAIKQWTAADQSL